MPLYEKSNQLCVNWLTRPSSVVQIHARPWRDRAIIYLLLATGLRREELVELDLSQLVLGSQVPSRQTRKAARRGADTSRPAITPEELSSARNVQLIEVKGKGRTLRNLHVGADARVARADYLEKERTRDAVLTPGATALFLRAASVGLPANANPEEIVGWLAVRQVNRILEQIKGWLVNSVKVRRFFRSKAGKLGQ